MTVGTLSDKQRGLHAPVYFIVDASNADLILTSPAQPGIYYINLAVLMNTSAGAVLGTALDGLFGTGVVDTAELADASVTALKLAQLTSPDVATGAGFRAVRARYSFAADGGTQGTKALLGATSIPANAVLVGGFLDVSTPPTSGGAATIAIQVEGANDTISAVAISGAPWSSAGRKSVIPAFTGLTTVKTTVARDVSAVIGAADLTAGVFDVYLFYIVTS